MNQCDCGRPLGYFDKYCDRCKSRLSLKEKVIEGIRHDEIFGSQFNGDKNND